MLPGADRVPVSSTTRTLEASVLAVAVNTLGAGRGVGLGGLLEAESAHEVAKATTSVMAGMVTATGDKRIYSLLVQGGQAASRYGFRSLLMR